MYFDNTVEYVESDKMKNVFGNKAFKSESEMITKVVNNLELFMNEIGVCSEILNYEIEHKPFFNPYKTRKGDFNKNLRLDLLVNTKQGGFGFEFKNPTHANELRAAISQIMEYMIYFPNYKFFLISSKYYDVASLLISHYNLDIGLVYFNGNQIANFKNIKL